MPPFSRQTPAPGAALVTLSGRTVVQLQHVAAGRPVVAPPIRYDLEVQADRQDDFEQLLRLASGGVVAQVWVPLQVAEAWWVPGAAGGVEWSLVGRTLPDEAIQARARRLLLDGTELAETALAPGAGEYRVSSATALETAALAGAVLTLIYEPILWGRLELGDQTYSDYNDLRLRLTITEARGSA